jgi:cytochrome c biogenesis protein CcmG/thiol:disulfide interchange protein DsbE
MRRVGVPRRRTIGLIVVAVVVIAAVIGVLQSRESSTDPAPPSAAEARSALRTAPTALRSLYDRGGTLVDLTPAAFEGELRSLRGYPVVLNVWAQWCGPCREEFPLLRTAAARYGTRIAFLGVNVDAASSRGRAERFLREQPTAYPSVTDPDERIARRLEASGRPSTVFLDPQGRIVTVRQGAYARLEDLERDLRMYAGLDGRPAPGTTTTSHADDARER